MCIPRCFPVMALCFLPLSRADVRACLCDVAVPETLEARECGLCKEAEKQPSGVPYLFLRDTNPNKSHRRLPLPPLHAGRPPPCLPAPPPSPHPPTTPPTPHTSRDPPQHPAAATPPPPPEPPT